jgi:asparagine synthase (glutamine-hydrolysing)
MCGISGVISSSVLGAAQADTVREMNRRLLHRGPDSEGVHAQPHVILAMRRLSIVDLAGGRQPLFNETGDIAIVCNGEIYNHRELRAELEALGHCFASHSDVETIVHAYEAWGLGCLQKLRGMFGFALWDARAGRLLLARDRMGEKPLFLHREGGQLWFSSELRSLTAALRQPPRLTPEAFNFFLAFQYVPEPEPVLQGIEVLPAGHYLELTPKSLDARPVPYWDLCAAHADPSDPVRTTEEILDRACLLQGTADVPVAVALSGGIDSSLVAALTARHYPGQLHALTVGYEGRPPTDERGFAATLATELGIGFTEVELRTRDVVDGFPALVAAMDLPIGDIAAFGYWAVSRASRQAGYPVLLSGMGGDEFFWGYEWVREAVTRNQALLDGTAQPRVSWLQRLLGRTPAATKPDFFGVHEELARGNSWSRLLMPASLAARMPDDLWLQRNALDTGRPVHQAVTDLLNRTWLRSNCLALADRMSMAHSVEMRLPLLDIGLVETVTGMRNDGLVDWTKPHKWLLVEALRDVLPADLLARKKQGFTPPVQDWMAGIVGRFSHLVQGGALMRQGLVNPDVAGNGLQAYGLSFQYKLVLLECWTRLHVEGMPVHALEALAPAQA